MTTAVRISSSFSYHSQIYSITQFLFIIVTMQSEQITMFSYWLRWAKIEDSVHSDGGYIRPLGASKFVTAAAPYLPREATTTCSTEQVHVS